MRVSMEKALFAARFFLASKTFTDDETMVARKRDSQASLNADPEIVHDLQGARLFYEFRVHGGDGDVIGSIRCAADSSVGSPVIGYMMTPLDHEISQRARAVFEADHPRASDIKTRLTCYCFPKIAVDVSGHIDGQNKTVFYDAYTLEQIADDPNLDALTLSKKEGFALKSYQDSVREGSDAEAFFDDGLNDMKSVVSVASLEPQAPATMGAFATKKIRDFEAAEYEYLSKFFRENPPAIRSLVLPVPLFGQETKDYCAMASAQMIFAYMGINMTQTQIADLMNHGPGGADPADQLRGYAKVFAGRLDVLYDRDPTWGEAVAALDRSIPFKSAVGLHARICRGWKRFDYLEPVTKRLLMSENYLLINDPNPVAKGQTYWEAMKIHIYRNAVTFAPQ